MARRFLVLTFLCFVASISAQGASEEKLCPGEDGSRCVAITECLGNENSGKDLTVCGHDKENNSQLVCCPANDKNRRPKNDKCDDSFLKLTPSGRVAFRKCREYAAAVFFKDEQRKQTKTNPSCPFDCSNINEVESDERKYGLEKQASLKQFPFMALIGYENKDPTFRCAGILISEKFVLASAHCFANDTIRNWVRLGQLNFKPNSEETPKPIDRNVTRIFKHPQYKDYKSDDLALLELEKPVGFSSDVMPACLKVTKDNETKALSAGWGLRERGSVLRYTEVNMLPSEDCQEKIKLHSKSLSHVCGINNGSLFDSSSPLQSTSQNRFCMKEIFATASFSMKNPPTLVFTKIVDYLPWIVGLVWPNDLNEELSNY